MKNIISFLSVFIMASCAKSEEHVWMLNLGSYECVQLERDGHVYSMEDILEAYPACKTYSGKFNTTTLDCVGVNKKLNAPISFARTREDCELISNQIKMVVEKNRELR